VVLRIISVSNKQTKRPTLRPGVFISSKSVSRVLYRHCVKTTSIIDLDLPLPAGSSNLPIPISAGWRMEASNFIFGTYLVFQLLRFTAIPVARKSRELLPHVFTLTTPKAGGIFSVALAVAGCRRLPVRKQDALCCPDFPLPIVLWEAIERFADVKVGFLVGK